jgi:coenzyme F420-reducing hydrogenase delta subunit
MGVGPPGRTGRDQLSAVRAFITARRPGARDVVVIACDRGAGGIARTAGAGALVVPVTCAGNLHTSVIELLLRSATGGVLVVSCPPRDCWSREGPKWLEQRVYHDREAELQERVDRRRVRIVHAALGERAAVEGELAHFRSEIAALAVAAGGSADDLIRECVLEETQQ